MCSKKHNYTDLFTTYASTVYPLLFMALVFSQSTHQEIVCHFIVMKLPIEFPMQHRWHAKFTTSFSQIFENHENDVA